MQEKDSVGRRVAEFVVGLILLGLVLSGTLWALTWVVYIWLMRTQS